MADLVGRQLLALEVLVGEVVVHLGGRVDHVGAVLLGLGAQLLGDLLLVDVLAEVVAIEDRLHLDQVDDALEGVLAADRDLDRHARAPRRSRIDSTPRQKSAPVRSSLLMKQKRGHAVAVGLAPDRLGLRLHAGHAVEDDDRAIEHPEAPLDFNGEVHVPGRIDDVDAMVAPERRRCRGRDGDAPFLFLGHPVHRGRALMDLTDLVDLLRVEEDPLGDRGLAGVDMRDDSDVPRSCERNLTCHGVC